MVLGACSEAVRAYFESLEAGTGRAYEVARAARRRGFDPELDVEVHSTEDLASRVEELLADYGVRGVAARIRAVAEEHDREETAFLVAKEVAARGGSPEQAIERAVRVGLAILTEGVVVAPLEGLAGVKVKRNRDGSTYVDVYYAGPIRSAGGTAQALSVLIADVVRRQMGIGPYKATRGEVERFKEEIPYYKQLQHLQYVPSAEEVELVVSRCPVGINGEGTEDEEITGHRDLPRVETNRVRGGACLVIAEGLCLKAPKVAKHVRALGIDGWEFAGDLMRKRRTAAAEDDESGDRLMENAIAGRPVLCHPGHPGGLRLRYGRTRAMGLATVGLHPATLALLNDFVAVGTQLRTERPGKAGGVTPCESIEGPTVLLGSGDLVEVTTAEEARVLAGDVDRIVDLGEVLVPFGEFLENNHPLLPGSFSLEWYEKELNATGKPLPPDWREPTAERAFEIAERYGVALHPRYNLFWHDLTPADLDALRAAVAATGSWRDGMLVVPADPALQTWLILLGALHRRDGEELRVGRHALALVRCLGLHIDGERLTPDGAAEGAEALDVVSRYAGVVVRARAPTRIGARMGRPEKARERLMDPPPHGLFPLGTEGGPQRLLAKALEKEKVAVPVGLRRCGTCGRSWFLPRCPCGGHTEATGRVTDQPLPLRDLAMAARSLLGLEVDFEVKGVVGMISQGKTPEALEKAMLRAKHGVWVFKDGTSRFDQTNLPLTHFAPREVGLNVERARSLGYERDAAGLPLERDDQVLELRPQDVIPSRDAAAYFLRVAAFLDELLLKVYDLPPFYCARAEADLVGHLVLGLAPHTSVAVLGRIVGFTDARVCYAHPYFHAAKRRDCDGDEDSLILLMDGLVNFSRSYLPAKRGGLMDAPLALTVRVDPREVGKESHSIDVGAAYPLDFYHAAARRAGPKEVEPLIDTVGKRVGSVLQYEGWSYTHPTPSVAAGPLRSAYTSGAMVEKMEAQLELARKIRAVDEADVVARILDHHFLPDLQGNLKAFSSQSFRCPKCNVKYRRIPLRGRCTRCGGALTLTVHESSIKKYLDVSKRIAEEYRTGPYLRQRIQLIDESIVSLFPAERAKLRKLDEFP